MRALCCGLSALVVAVVACGGSEDTNNGAGNKSIGGGSGSGGEGGSAAATAGTAGAAGTTGGLGGSGGTSGSTTGGTAGTAGTMGGSGGTGGASASAGTGEVGGTAGAGGSGATGGSIAGGTAGTGGSAGMGATGGAGGIAGTAGNAGSAGTGGTGGTAPTCEPVDPAEIVTVGSTNNVLLRGMVVAPTGEFQGEVLIESDTLTCVAASCSTSPGAATAHIVETHGIILPGLIDAHNHVLFDIFDERHWTPAQPYTNHLQWVNEPKYDAMLDAKQYLNGQGTPSVPLSCELDKYGEMKGVVGGSTTIIGHTGTNRTCFGSLARTAEQASNGLGADNIQVSSLYPPSASSANGVCANYADGSTRAYLIHCGEGIDDISRNEINTLGTVTDPDNCLYAPQTTLVHATAFGDAELNIMAAHGMSLVWSSAVNVFLYGGGTDLTATPNIPLALQKGINVALGADWSIGGSQNMLDEMRFADKIDNLEFGDVITPKMLFEMATINSAKAMALQDVIGTLEVGKKADLFVIGGDALNPYDTLLASTPTDVRLVMVGGRVLYGDLTLQPLGPTNPGCETIDICCHQKFVCVAAPSMSATDKFGQTWAEITGNLAQGLAEYDALQLSQWTWSPMTPVVRCP